MSKQKPLDILKELYTQREEEGEFRQQTEALEDFFASMTQKETRDRQQSQPRRKKARLKKKKTTHYISREIDRELDRAKRNIKKMAPPAERSRITKSSIVDQALKLVLHEFSEKKDESVLVHELLDTDQEEK
jgi:hypothetical protein